MALALVAACHSSRTTPPPPPSSGAAPVLTGNQTGAPDPQSAVRGFLAAVHSQDLQMMGAIWGGPDGAARDAMSQSELYQREVIMICALKHDRFDLVGDAPDAAGGRALAVNLMTGNEGQVRTFNVVQGPKNRWYVKSVDLKSLGSCAKR
jgi:hypothetical protein